MICENIKRIKRYCSNYEQIENYQEAVSSPEKYDCHHRNEIDMNLSREELKEQGLYYNRPASELIFLTHNDHTKIHKMGNKNCLGRILSVKTKNKISHSMKGKVVSEETRNKISYALKGENNHSYKHICPALLQIMYIEQEKSANKMSQELGIGRDLIIRRLRELNIPIRK